ncbi:MAG: ABC transporter permease subunit [Gammaproteobacteria bacterium]|nr:ABC transporter permease subunit [Gammaproteobacteria bacterium]
MEAGFWEWLEMVSDNHLPIHVYLIVQHFDRFLWGAVITLQLTFAALITGALLCVPLAIARTSTRGGINKPVWIYTYCFRGTPLLVQTYLIYYGLGQFEVIRESFLWEPVLSSAWWCAYIAFTLNTTAYTTEILRGAIATTPAGEVEAARACGMSRWTVLRRIVLPSALRRSLPAYSNEVIFMLHASVIASTITLQDILGVGRWLNGRYYLAYEGFITSAVLYLILVYCITRGFGWWEKRWMAHLREREPTTASGAGTSVLGR